MSSLQYKLDGSSIDKFYCALVFIQKLKFGYRVNPSFVATWTDSDALDLGPIQKMLEAVGANEGSATLGSCYGNLEIERYRARPALDTAKMRKCT